MISIKGNAKLLGLPRRVHVGSAPRPAKLVSTAGAPTLGETSHIPAKAKQAELEYIREVLFGD